MSLQTVVDKLIAYSASLAAILGSVHNEMGGNHDQHAIYVAAAIAFIHHAKPILESIKASLPPTAPKT